MNWPGLRGEGDPTPVGVRMYNSDVLREGAMKGPIADMLGSRVIAVSRKVSASLDVDTREPSGDEEVGLASSSTQSLGLYLSE